MMKFQPTYKSTHVEQLAVSPGQMILSKDSLYFDTPGEKRVRVIGGQFEEDITASVGPVIDDFVAVPQPGIREVGAAIPSISLSANIVRKTNPIIVARIVTLPSTVLAEADNSPEGGAISVIDSEGVDNGVREYQCFVEDDQQFTAAATLRYEFVWPAFIGAVDSPTPNTAILQSLKKYVVKKSSISHNFAMKNKYMCAVFPASWGEIKSIVDPSGHDLTHLFNRSTVELEQGSYSQEYNVYVFSAVNSFDGFLVNLIF